jgi:4-alpha-glucanotransferase
MSDGANAMIERRAGLLLHPTSLPGPYGIGDLGEEAERFLDWAASAGASIWQILPLGPPGPGNSPYSSASAFAGNPLLLSPERLVQEGILAEAELESPPRFSIRQVDFSAVASWKERLLRHSWNLFRQRGSAELLSASASFAAAPEAAEWLADWTLYAALKRRFGGSPWYEWRAELRGREPEALEAARRELAEEIACQRHLQFLFHRQWSRLKQEANRRGLWILGDLPLYVALDSADVWSHRELFDLDDQGQPRHVAGVPPDYFSKTGQRWGNPLYRWDRIADQGYRWWIERVGHALRQVDFLRIDHFRGLAAYWEIPAEEPTAVRGRWRPGPGVSFFEALRRELRELPIVAEDLGIITDDVRELRKSVGLPGMKVLQFAFGSDDSDHLPGRFGPDHVLYTGTHDNDTTVGWFEVLGEEERTRVLRYLGKSAADSRIAEEIHWEMMRAALESEASLAVLPVQDVLGLGSEARMNNPSTPEGNWAWRAAPGSFRPELARRLKELIVKSGREKSR